MSAAHDGGGEALFGALEYVAAGYAVGPVTIRLDGDGKKAARFHTSWERDPDGITRDPDQVKAWAARWPGCGWHAPCGPNGMVIAEGDVKGETSGVWNWRKAKAPTSPMTVTTRSGGEHWYFAAPDEPIRNSTDAIEDVRGVDVRGDGGTVFIAGTTVHDGGGHYWTERVVPRDELPELPGWWADRLREAGPSGARTRSTARSSTSSSLVPSSAFHDADWVIAKYADLVRVLRSGRADFRDHLSAAALVGFRAADLELIDEDKVREDLDDAVRVVWDAEPNRRDEKWISDARADATDQPWRLVPAIGASADGSEQVENSSEQVDEREPTTWAPRDLARFLVDDPDEVEDEPGPTALRRTDGVPLAYAGKVNGLIGESESGKSWVALHGAEQAVTAGGHVLYVDFEDSARGVTSRMRALGATAADLRERFVYIGPEEGLGQAARDDLLEALAAREWSVIVVDGFNMAMTLLGLDLLSNTDVGLFFARVLRPMARTGAAVIYVDHVPKNADNRGKGGIGAQQKRALTDGAALRVEVNAAFGRGQTGKLRLTVDKDRPGHVRGVAVDASWVGTAVLASDGVAGTVLAVIEPATGSGGGRREPTHVMEKVSTFLQGAPDQDWSNAAVADAVGGNKSVVLAALEALTLRGHVRREPGPRGAVLNRFVSRFTAFVSEVDDAVATALDGDEDDR